MIFPTEIVEDLQKLNESVSLESQVKAVRLQDKLAEQDYQHKTEKLFEPFADITKNTSENLMKTLTENSIINNKAIENLNEKILELLNDKGMISPFLASSIFILFKPENKSQFKLIKDLISTK